MKLLKGFLEANKIYFETICAVVLGLTALYISWQQKLQTDLQNRLTSAQVAPQFVLIAPQKINPELQRVTEDEILVTNKGGGRIRSRRKGHHSFGA